MHLSRRSSKYHADRKSTRLNSSHLVISYAVFCLKNKRNHAMAIVACDFMVAVTAQFQFLYVFVIVDRGPGRILHCNVTALFFFFNDSATTGIYTLSLRDPLPI